MSTSHLDRLFSTSYSDRLPTTSHSDRPPSAPTARTPNNCWPAPIHQAQQKVRLLQRTSWQCKVRSQESPLAIRLPIVKFMVRSSPLMIGLLSQMLSVTSSQITPARPKLAERSQAVCVGWCNRHGRSCGTPYSALYIFDFHVEHHDWVVAQTKFCILGNVVGRGIGIFVSDSSPFDYTRQQSDLTSGPEIPQWAKLNAG